MYFLLALYILHVITRTCYNYNPFGTPATLYSMRICGQICEMRSVIALRNGPHIYTLYIQRPPQFFNVFGPFFSSLRYNVGLSVMVHLYLKITLDMTMSWV